MPDNREPRDVGEEVYRRPSIYVYIRLISTTFSDYIRGYVIRPWEAVRNFFLSLFLNMSKTMAGNREPRDVGEEIDRQPSMFNENRRHRRSSSESNFDRPPSMLDANRSYNISSREAEVYRRPSRYGDDIRLTDMTLYDVNRGYDIRSREAEVYRRPSRYGDDIRSTDMTLYDDVNRGYVRRSREAEIYQRSSTYVMRVTDDGIRFLYDTSSWEGGTDKKPKNPKTQRDDSPKTQQQQRIRQKGTDKKPSPRDDSPKTQQQQRIRQKEIDKMPPTRDDSLKTLQQQMIIQKEGKRMEQITKEVELEYLIHELILEERYLEDRLQKKRAIKRIRRLKRKLAKVWNELRILRQVDKRWSIQEEVANLFDVSLKLSYPEFKDVKSTIFSCIEKFGDYQCENVLSIWPKLRKEGTMHLGPRRVGWKIKRNLELLRPEMIEREPWVLDIGFVSIKLSEKWMAKGIHKMLRDGIDTWAPKLLVKSVLVNFPSCNPAYLTQMDLLRRELIKTTLMHMLQYCKIRVEFSMPCETALPQEQLDMFRIEKRVDGDVLIFRSAEGEREPLIHAKRDEWSGDPENDLADLWYGLKKKNANWIVCLTPVQQQEYIKMCIKAAQHAEWLPPNWRDSPRASYTGYQTYNTKLKHEDLDSFLDAAKSNCEAAAKELGYTGEEVVNCALKYTILKNDRLADYAFNSQEMQLNGNTFVYLLITQARIRSFTKESRKYISDFASQKELTLGKGEIWQDGKERVLVQHLLAFTQVIEESCLPVLLHILCEYLYDLSKNFNSLYEAGFVAETTNLLLYEATRVVMDKCFQLLGITPESSSLGVDCQLPSSELTKSLLQVESLNRKDPPKITTRFELFSIYPHITRDPDFKEGNLFGQIAISDTYSLLSDGWGLTSVPDHGYVALFDCNWPSSIDITNHRAVYFGNPSSRNLVPFSSFMEVRVELYASTEGSDAVFELCNCYIDAEFEDFLRGDGDTRRSMWISEGKDGHIRMYYILLKDAKDSTIKVTYHPQRDKEDYGGEVFAEIFAYYGSDFFDKKVDPFEKNYYTARLFRNSFDPNMPEIPLQKSMLAVPANGSIEIVACLWDVDSGDMILNDHWTFRAGVVDEQKKDGSCGSLHVSVKWN